MSNLVTNMFNPNEAGVPGAAPGATPDAAPIAGGAGAPPVSGAGFEQILSS